MWSNFPSPVKIEWIQQIQNLANVTQYDGTVTPENIPAGTTDDPSRPSGWGSPGGKVGWPFSISGHTATLSPVDEHRGIDDTAGTITIGTTKYDYARINSTACKFQDKIRRKAGAASLGEFDWSYTWDNNNDTWPASPSLEVFSAATGFVYTEAAYGGVHPGSKQGEFSNVSGVAIP